ncbi:MAG TPA: recombinase family protein, partial [Rhizomicrobium sp.]|nr:recombinase family protein [Rhizomicrobium sp.]
KLIAELVEVESGRKNDRPVIKEALWHSRVYGAKLVVARLDRLARSTALIAGLMESGVDFVAADMPFANRFTLHIIAAVAEYEARLISERTKAAFAIAKAQGRKFGSPRPGAGLSPAVLEAKVRKQRERAKAHALEFAPLLCELRDRGETINGIAAQLTLMEIATPRDAKKWSHNLVRKMFERAGERKPKPRLGRRPKTKERPPKLTIQSLLRTLAPATRNFDCR